MVNEATAPLSREQLRSTFASPGRVTWIGVRPGHRDPVVPLKGTQAVVGSGLEGDRFAPQPGGPGHRQVTLIQAEHLAVVAGLVGLDRIDPVELRRNLVVEGINVTALVGWSVRVGDALLEVGGPCEPCARMEENLGPGGYNAMRGHGGWNAKVAEGGPITLGSPVTPVPPDG